MVQLLGAVAIAVMYYCSLPPIPGAMCSAECLADAVWNAGNTSGFVRCRAGVGVAPVELRHR